MNKCGHRDEETVRERHSVMEREIKKDKSEIDR